MLVAFANKFRMHKIGAVDQFVMMYGGMRGGVAFALVLLIDPAKVRQAPIFVTATIAMIYWTSFVQGITIKPLVKILGVKISEEKNPTMNERINGRTMDHIVAGVEAVLGELGGLGLRYIYNHIDQLYIKPCLLRDPTSRDQKIIETYEKRVEEDAVEFVKEHATKFMQFRQSMIPTIDNQVSLEIDFCSTVSNSRHSSRDHADVDIHSLLSANLIEPTNKRRKISSSRNLLNETDILETSDSPSVRRYQLTQAAQKWSSTVGSHNPKNNEISTITNGLVTQEFMLSKEDGTSLKTNYNTFNQRRAHLSSI